MMAEPCKISSARAPSLLYKILPYKDRTFLYSAATNQLYSLGLAAAEALGAIEADAATLYAAELKACPKADGKPLRPLNRAAICLEVQNGVRNQLQQIVLGVTERCNLRCSYCVYSDGYAGTRNHSRARMPWEVAKAAIDYLFSHRSESRVPPGIAFYGGEPLLELDLIQRCVEYIRAKGSEEARFVITTNGMRLDRRARSLMVRGDFTLIVSLDGPSALHDRFRRDAGNRPTFSHIATNLQALREEAPDYYAHRVRFSVVLAPPVDYGALLAFFDSVGAPCVVSPLEGYGLGREWQQNPPADFTTLANAFREAIFSAPKGGSPDLWRHFAVGFLGPALRRIQSRAERGRDAYFRLGQCIPGVRKVFVDWRGDFYPCEKSGDGSEVRIGDIRKGVDEDAVIRLLGRFRDIVRRHCGGCWMRRMCSACLADVVHGGRFELQKLMSRCGPRRAAFAELLGFYAALLEDDPTALDFLPTVFPWG